MMAYASKYKRLCTNTSETRDSLSHSLIIHKFVYLGTFGVYCIMQYVDTMRLKGPVPV